MADNKDDLNLRVRDDGVWNAFAKDQLGKLGPTSIPGPWTDMGYTYLEMAAVLAKRSKCARAKVGAIVTDWDLRNIESLGYNGPEHGGPNSCRGTGEGQCGCIHGEMNALIKAPYDKGPLVMFSTTSPCQTCAMLIRQSRIEAIYYTTPYRLLEGVTLLQDRGLIVQHVPNKEA